MDMMPKVASLRKNIFKNKIDLIERTHRLPVLRHNK